MQTQTLSFDVTALSNFYHLYVLKFQTNRKFSRAKILAWRKQIVGRGAPTAILSKSARCPDMRIRGGRRGIICSHRFLSRCRENEKLKGWVNDMRSCRVVSTGTISQFLPILFLVLHSHPKAIVPPRCLHLFRYSSRGVTFITQLIKQVVHYTESC